MSDRLGESSHLCQHRLNVDVPGDFVLQNVDSPSVIVGKRGKDGVREAGDIRYERFPIRDDAVVIVDANCRRGPRADEDADTLSTLRQDLA